MTVVHKRHHQWLCRQTSSASQVQQSEVTLACMESACGRTFTCGLHECDASVDPATTRKLGLSAIAAREPQPCLCLKITVGSDKSQFARIQVSFYEARFEWIRVNSRNQTLIKVVCTAGKPNNLRSENKSDYGWRPLPTRYWCVCVSVVVPAAVMAPLSAESPHHEWDA